MQDQRSIAVLPFDNLSADPDNEYFSDGVTEEIINALSKVEGLKVTARTSAFVFKNQKQDIRQIGADLDVALVLEGSVRKAGNRVRITAQLIRADNGFHIWSENFDRELTDIFQLQDEISLLIANKIREDFGHLEIEDHLIEAPTKSVEAYQLFLRGRYHHNLWDMGGFANALDFHTRSIRADANFDWPYFGAGLSYSFMGSWGGMERVEAFQRAEDMFQKGRSLEPSSVYGYYCEAKHLFWGLWNYGEAHSMLTRALELQPEDANTNEFIAEIHTALGDFERAHKFIDEALRISPLAPNHFYTKANILYLEGRYLEAVKLIDRGLALAPGFNVLIELKLACLIQLGARKELDELVGANDLLLVPEVYAVVFDLLHEGVTNDATVVGTLSKVRNHPGILFGWDMCLLANYDTAEALELLEKKALTRVGQVINFKHDPFLSALREESTFEDLVKQYFPDQSIRTGIPKAASDKALMLTEEDVQRYTTSLRLRMEEQKDYLKADLGLRELAKNVGLHPNKLSWLLNEALDQNFYEFTNGYRLREFQRRALDPDSNHLSILGIALDSGFNSKSVFNDFFKKSTGLTPKAWVSQNSQG